MEPGFVRIYREEDKEFRQYAGYLVASSKETGNYTDATERAYMRLLAYLSGQNSAAIKISSGEPIFQQRQHNEWIVSVTLPSPYDLTSAPLPLDDRVILRKVAPQKVAVIEYDLANTPERINEKELELLSWLEHQDDFAPVSTGRVAQYVAPPGVPLVRPNEIQIDVKIV